MNMLLEYLTRHAWAVERGSLQRMVEIVTRHYRGQKLSTDEIAAITDARDARAAEKAAVEMEIAGDVAVIRIDGVIAKHSRMVNGHSQPRGTSIEDLVPQLDAAVANLDVAMIFLRIESPGGSIAGLADFADRVYRAGAVKPVIAFADDLAASAAYWIGSQASRFYANQSAAVGSIGVYSLLADTSAMHEREGIQVHIVRSGPHKGVGAPGIQITDEQLGPIQDLVDADYEMFLTAITRGRGARGPDAHGKKLRELADGRLYPAAEAVRHGLIDGVMTLQSALAAKRPAVRRKDARSGSSAAAVTVPAITATAPAARASTSASAGASTSRGPVRSHEAWIGRTTEARRPKVPVRAGDDGDPAAFTAAVHEFKAGGKSKAQAMRAAAVKFPRAHRAWLAAGCPDGGLVDDGRASTFKAAVEYFEAEGATRLKALRDAAVKYPDAYRGWTAANTAAAHPAPEPRPGDDGTARTYAQGVNAALAAGKSRSAAHRQAAVDLPQSHRVWIRAGCRPEPQAVETGASAAENKVALSSR